MTTKEKNLIEIIEEERQARIEAYKGYCNEFTIEWGDNRKPMSFEEWEKDFEEYGGWETYI